MCAWLVSPKVSRLPWRGGGKLDAHVARVYPIGPKIRTQTPVSEFCHLELRASPSGSAVPYDLDVVAGPREDALRPADDPTANCLPSRVAKRVVSTRRPASPMVELSPARRPPHVDPVDRRLVRVVSFAVVALIVVMVVLPFLLDEATRLRLYGDETSPIEVVSAWAWVVLAGMLPVVFRSCSPAVLAASVVCLAFAAREADWHKLYTGYSVLKPKFYLLQEQEWTTRAVAAIVVLAAVASGWIALRALWRSARVDGGVGAAWVRLAIIVAALGVATKLTDRLPAIVGSVGVDVPAGVRLSFKSFEELGEFLLPFLMLVVALLFARVRRRDGDALTSGRSADSASASAG